jgi:hypothetical protein
MMRLSRKFIANFREKYREKRNRRVRRPASFDRLKHTLREPFRQTREPMFNDRRRSVRYSFNRYARIQAEMAGASRDCLIVNMSEDGVRLHSEAEFPDAFTLVIAEAARPRRSCRVVWRLGFEIGARFTDNERARATG